MRYKDLEPIPVQLWRTAQLRNAAPEVLIQRLKIDIEPLTDGQGRFAQWAPRVLRPVIAAMFPDGLDDLLSLDRSRPAAVEAANADTAFLLLDYFGSNAALMRSALAIVLWIAKARRTTLNVATRVCRDNADLDQNLRQFLDRRRCQQFKKDMRL